MIVDCATERSITHSVLLGHGFYRRVFNVSRLEEVYNRKNGSVLVDINVSSYFDIHSALRGAVAVLMQPLIEHDID